MRPHINESERYDKKSDQASASLQIKQFYDKSHYSRKCNLIVKFIVTSYSVMKSNAEFSFPNNGCFNFLSTVSKNKVFDEQRN